MPKRQIGFFPEPTPTPTPRTEFSDDDLENNETLGMLNMIAIAICQIIERTYNDDEIIEVLEQIHDLLSEPASNNFHKGGMTFAALVDEYLREVLLER